MSSLAFASKLRRGVTDSLRMIYSSITPYVHMLRTAEDDEEHVCLDFSDPNPRRGAAYGYDSFGVGQLSHIEVLLIH